MCGGTWKPGLTARAKLAGRATAPTSRTKACSRRDWIEGGGEIDGEIHAAAATASNRSPTAARATKRLQRFEDRHADRQPLGRKDDVDLGALVEARP